MNELATTHRFDVREGSWIEWPCGVCGEESSLFIDPSGGGDQVLVEDCTVCCRPNLIRLTILYEDEIVSLRISPE